MVLWIKKHYKIVTLIYCLAISLFAIYPLLSNKLYIGHDTLFHLSRIEGLATSIKNGVLIPDIYPFKNTNYGYASSLFYCDLLLYPFALLYLFNVDIVICYKLCIFVFTFIACLSMMSLVNTIQKNKFATYLSPLLYITTTYRFTNIFVRGALGEIMSYAFLPIVLIGIYKLFYKKESSIFCITAGFSLLIMSHNISFILACILFLLFIIINIYKLNKRIIYDIIISIILVVLLTSFFTFGMLEQLLSQDFYLSSNTSLFITSKLYIFQLFINDFFYGMSGNYDVSMVTNTGIFLLILPIFNLLDIENNDKSFLNHCIFLGIIFMFLTLGIINLKYFSLISVIQFVWRFISLSCLLLTIPSSICIFNCFKNHHRLIFALLAILIGLNSIILLYKTINSIYIPLKNNTKYEELIDGSIIDPYYSAFYVRVELAGADYLPIDSIDYKQRKYGIYLEDTDTFVTDNIKDEYNIEFDLNLPNTSIVVPKTYYKGYSVYNIQNKKLVKLACYQDPQTKLLAFNTKNTTGTYIVKYEKTLIQKTSIFISITTLIFVIIFFLKKSRKIKIS